MAVAALKQQPAPAPAPKMFHATVLVTRAESRGEGAERLILEVSVATLT